MLRNLETRQARNKYGPRCRKGGRLYHASPFVIAVGCHIKPRWCPYQAMYGAGFAVYMATSLRKARDVASAILEGYAGYAGTRPEHPGSPLPTRPNEDFRGAWIYRVAATGPLATESAFEVTTAFPVRVLEVVGKLGEPERNTRQPPTPMADLESAAIYRGDRRTIEVDAFERLWRRFERSRRKSPDRRLHAFLKYLEPDRYERDDPNGLRRVHVAFTRARDQAEARALFLDLVRQENECLAGVFEHQRRRSHRRLFPDPRHDRRRDAPLAEEP